MTSETGVFHRFGKIFDEVRVLHDVRLSSMPKIPRCVIVDDHGDTRVGYAEFLSAFGFDVRTAADADELRVILKEWVPDTIVLDLQLPRTDGWQLTREIKGDSRTSQIVIVVVTACAMPAERAAAEAAGCDSFITKPVDPMVILEELKRLTRTDSSVADDDA
jgi:two-component system cell cycle response regulator DivK